MHFVLSRRVRFFVYASLFTGGTFWCAAPLAAGEPAAGTAFPGPKEGAQRLEFTRLVAHWTSYGEPAYLKFLEDAQPDIAQVGFYGGHFYSLSHRKEGAGYPAHFPVLGLRECGDFFQKLNAEIHSRKIKVVGHINLTMMIGEPASPQGPQGFFKFYNELWDEKELGPKPVANPLDLFEKNADGTPLVNNQYSIGGMKEYWACLGNPHWRTVLKAWTKRAIERGVDGFIINYFYRHNCLCEHCQGRFKTYLAKHFTPLQLREQFGIENVQQHKFTEIVGWHDPKSSTPLKREMLKFSQMTTKDAFDEVFIEYGRKLKPDLIVGQWNHLGEFNQISGDERSMLPADLWGRGEDYLWYSTGGAANFTDLAAGIYGDATLQARYIRGAFQDKPFTLGKYEATRIRAAIAELAANGGAPMGFYTNFQDPVAREVIVRYYRFIKRYEELYKGNRPHAEILLLYPRTAVHQGKIAFLEEFKATGKRLLDAHILFDVLPDDMLTTAVAASYLHVVKFPQTQELPPVWASQCSNFFAPAGVRVSASRPAEDDSEIDLHFVNYNRLEQGHKRSAGSGIAEERPIAVRDVSASVRLPAGMRVVSVEAISPEASGPEGLKTETKNGVLTFKMPEILVYGVARIKLEAIKIP